MRNSTKLHDVSTQKLLQITHIIEIFQSVPIMVVRESCIQTQVQLRLVLEAAGEAKTNPLEWDPLLVVLSQAPWLFQ